MDSFFLHNDSNDFPSPDSTNDDCILAIGGNLNVDTLLKAYRMGTFPWYNEGEPIVWHHPDPRFVLFPQNVKISHSMRNVINQHRFRFSFDKNFKEVIRGCRMARRSGMPGTWITDEIEIAYTRLFKEGYAHSAEAWQNNELVGGLYGVLLGKVFFGESMFANESNASKFAFIKWVDVLKENGIELIDCQIYTSHLESLGAGFISRNDFVALLKELIP
ncbi:MAG: leucyl/phenylalanyl-tRNA--protein transferase [Ginsengibacter sp.]